MLSWQFCEGQGGCLKPMGYCEAFGCNPEYPSPHFGSSGSTSRYAGLEQGVPHLSHPDSMATLPAAVEGATSTHYADVRTSVEYANQMLVSLDGGASELDLSGQFPYERAGERAGSTGVGAAGARTDSASVGAGRRWAGNRR